MSEAKRIRLSPTNSDDDDTHDHAVQGDSIELYDNIELVDSIELVDGPDGEEAELVDDQVDIEQVDCIEPVERSDGRRGRACRRPTGRTFSRRSEQE